MRGGTARRTTQYSDPACGTLGLQPQRDGRVRCSAWLGGVGSTLNLIQKTPHLLARRERPLRNLMIKNLTHVKVEVTGCLANTMEALPSVKRLIVIRPLNQTFLRENEGMDAEQTLMLPAVGDDRYRDQLDDAEKH